MLIETRVNVNEDEVWDSVWGNDGQGFAYWVSRVRDFDGKDFHATKMVGVNGDVEINNPQDFVIWTDDGDKHIVTLYALCKAYADLRAEGWTHCGGSLLDDNDACTEDAILQKAVFGEFVYG
jgi:hypothetical protein